MMLHLSPLDKGWPGTLARATGGGVDLQRNVHHETDFGQGAVGTPHEGFTWEGGEKERGEKRKRVGGNERDGERETQGE